jgi:hypothetical protein
MFSMNLPATVLAAVAVCSVSAIAMPVKINKTMILAEHNRYRAKVGVPPLIWSDSLAKGAQRWADTIAALDRMQHSGTWGVGENLAYWSGPNASPLRTMIGLWEREKAYFRPGTFPSVSTNGNWLSVAHYTQMVWRRTKKVGCGIGNNGRTDFLVCWYSPRGNYLGEVPY